MKNVITKRQIVSPHGYWNLFPCIEVSFVDAIPSDYPGLMGVPITVLDKVDFDDKSQFLLMDKVRPTINGRAKFNRLIIRNKNPDLPDEMSLDEFNERLAGAGSRWQLNERES